MLTWHHPRASSLKMLGLSLWEGRLPGQKTIENEDKAAMGSYRPESNFGTSDTVLYQLFTTRFHFLRFHFHRYDHLRAPTPGRRPPQRSPSCQHTPARQETRHGPNTRITQHLQAISALISSVCCVGRESGGPRPSPVAVMHQEVPLSRAARAGPAQTPAKASRVGLKRLRSGGMPPTNSGPQMRRTCMEMAAGRQPPG